MSKDRLILDEVDTRLIRSLQNDARQSLRTIAKQAKVSVPTLAMKLKRLIELGAIRSFSIIVDSETFGFRDYVVEINLRPRYLKKSTELAGDFSHFLVTQDSRIVGIFSGTERDAASLYTRLSSANGVEKIAITPTIKHEVNTGKPDIVRGCRLSISCYLCKADINSSPLTIKHSGRTRYFCCTSCKSLFIEKHSSVEP